MLEIDWFLLTTPPAHLNYMFDTQFPQFYQMFVKKWKSVPYIMVPYQLEWIYVLDAML